jgi:hypothetical protein
MRGAAPSKGPEDVLIRGQKIHSLSFSLFLLCCGVDLFSTLPARFLAMHEEKGEQNLQTFSVLKAARGTTIRILGSESARPFEGVRLRTALPL